MTHSTKSKEAVLICNVHRLQERNKSRSSKSYIKLNKEETKQLQPVIIYVKHDHHAKNTGSPYIHILLR